MENQVCPHCHTEVPVGAGVCTGCQAEVEYGAPKEAKVAAVLIAVVLGVIAGVYTNSVLGWIVFAVLLVGGFLGVVKLFSSRVCFKRLRQTR